MEEIWKDIKGYEGYYQVSNHGNVKSLERIVFRDSVQGNYLSRERFLKQHLNGDKYRCVGLKVDKNNKTVRVHRLVATHFIPNPENKPEVNHLRGKENNTVNDLEWATPEENVAHAFRTGIKTGNYGKVNGNSKIVIDLETGIFYECTREAAIAKNINNSTLISRLNGRLQNTTELRYV